MFSFLSPRTADEDGQQPESEGLLNFRPRVKTCELSNLGIGGQKRALLPKEYSAHRDLTGNPMQLWNSLPTDSSAALCYALSLDV